MIFLILILVGLAFLLYLCYKHNTIINNDQMENNKHINDNHNNNHYNNQNNNHYYLSKNKSLNNHSNNESIIEQFEPSPPTPPSGEAVESGHCYQPNITDTDYTFDLDTNMIQQMSKVKDVNQYITLVNSMKQQYKNRLSDTINQLYNEQNNLLKDLENTKTEFNKYGMKTLSKQYYDTIFQHGDYNEVKDNIIIPGNPITNSENKVVTP